MVAQDAETLIRRGLKLSHLRLVAALAETGQISGAASQLSISQPAASRLLADLERLLDTRLYRRLSRGVELTPAGALLAERARRILGDLGKTGEQITRLASGFSGRVAIGAVTGPALELVLPAIRRARVTHPDIEVAVNVDTSDKLAEALQAGRLDFYLGRVLPMIDPRGLSVHPIGPEPVTLIVRRGHPLDRKGPVTLEECLRYDWVLQAPGGLQRQTVENYLLEHGYRPPARVVSTSSLLMTMALVVRTNAIGPITRSVARFYGSAQGLDARIAELPVAPDMAVPPYALIVRLDEILSPAATVLRDMVIDAIPGPAGSPGRAEGVNDRNGSGRVATRS